MSKFDTYYQFPLSALSYGMCHDQRWKDVMNLACLFYGRKALVKSHASRLQEAISSYLRGKSALKDYQGTEDQHALLAAYQAGLSMLENGLEPAIQSAQAAWQHCQHQPYPTVRIRADLWRKTFQAGSDKKPLTFREFAVLCAVYAAVGAKPYAKISLKRILAYAAGAPNYATFLARQKAGDVDSLFLSMRQVRTTLNNLEANKFFVKFTYNRGECFYSNKLGRTELSALIARRKLRKLETLAINRREDQANSQMILTRKKLAGAPYSNDRPPKAWPQPLSAGT